jgi:hypothetical protein
VARELDQPQDAVDAAFAAVVHADERLGSGHSASMAHAAFPSCFRIANCDGETNIRTFDTMPATFVANVPTIAANGAMIAANGAMIAAIIEATLTNVVTFAACVATFAAIIEATLTNVVTFPACVATFAAIIEATLTNVVTFPACVATFAAIVRTFATIVATSRRQHRQLRRITRDHLRRCTDSSHRRRGSLIHAALSPRSPFRYL